jgi:hypothetical protein
MSNWRDLPVELQLMVGELLLDDPGSVDIDGPHARLTAYTTVCKEWQAFFEPKIYRRLKLSQSCLTGFDKFVRRQRGLVEHVWLCIQLKPYDCPLCDESEKQQWSDCNKDTVGNAVWALFRILSRWKPHQSRGNAGITLEISVHSPSDSEHAFKDCQFETPIDSTSLEQPVSANMNDPIHGWTNGQRTAVPKLDAISRVYQVRINIGTPIDIGARYKLPQVEVVTRLLIRRQTRRQLTSLSLRQILASLPKLEHMNLEIWRRWYSDCQRRSDRGISP